jgi:hypothetical protein
MMRRGRAVRHLVDFDSGVNMVGELGRFGEGKNYRGLSMGPGSRRLADLASSLPARVRRGTFSMMGGLQGSGRSRPPGSAPTTSPSG